MKNSIIKVLFGYNELFKPIYFDHLNKMSVCEKQKQHKKSPQANLQLQQLIVLKIISSSFPLNGTTLIIPTCKFNSLQIEQSAQNKNGLCHSLRKIFSVLSAESIFL